MKSILKYIGIVLLALVASCQDDLLDKYPLDELSEASYWSSEKDFENYVNKFYDFVDSRRGWQSKYGWENGTDNIVGKSEISFPDGKIYRLSGDASQNSGTWSGGYSNIRRINYFFENMSKIPAEKITAYGKQYIGEAHFFRAYEYFKLLSTFGGVPYIDKVLNLGDTEELYKVRESREFIANKIMEDLDKAIENLNWAGENNCVAARISKEAALGYKAKFALFEGSWEYYHKNTDFGVSGKNGAEFLKQVVSAGDQLINKLGTNIFKGTPGKEYWDMFNKKNYAEVAGALHYRVNSKAEGITVLWANYARGGGQVGITKSVIDDYLMADGTPKELSADYKGDDTFAELVDMRDPRLSQTIYYKEKWGTMGDLLDWPIANEMPGITKSIMYYYVPTGYYIAKGVLPDKMEYSQNGWGEQGLVYLRYAEVLIAYAEAKAILEELGEGALTQADIDKTINVVRSRIGMGNMNLSTVKGWEGNANYVKRYKNESSVINEIRRERRIELVCESQRYDDLRRWKAMGELIVGWTPRGAKAQQFLDYYEPQGKLSASDITVDADGYLMAFGYDSRFNVGGEGCIIDEKRDYLWSIPMNQINLYKEKADVVLTQNPGWH